MGATGAASSGDEARPRGQRPGGAARSDRRPVWVLRDGKPVRTLLRTGITDGSQTEIVDGELKEGDLVITDVTMGTSTRTTPSSAAAQNNLPRRMF